VKTESVFLWDGLQNAGALADVIHRETAGVIGSIDGWECVNGTLRPAVRFSFLLGTVFELSEDERARIDKHMGVARRKMDVLVGTTKRPCWAYIPID
jgi:hypothetical protein